MTLTELLNELADRQGYQPPYTIERLRSRAHPGRTNIFVTAKTEANCWLGIEAAGGDPSTYTAPVRAAESAEYISIGHEQGERQ